MKKNSFLLTAVSTAIFASAIGALGQEILVPSPVQEEQGLMVTIRLQIADGGRILTEKQDGFVLFPQTVITTMSPLMILGARATVITKKREIPVHIYFVDAELGLAELMLVTPFDLDVTTVASRLFSTEEQSENLFLLTSRGISSADALTQKEDGLNYSGAIIVDSYGGFTSVVLSVKKHDSGELIPRLIPRHDVARFIRYHQKESSIPEMPEDQLQDNSEISLDKI